MSAKLKFKAKVPLPDEILLPEGWAPDTDGTTPHSVWYRIEGRECCVSMYLGHTLGMFWHGFTLEEAIDRLVRIGFDESSARELIRTHDEGQKSLSYRMALEAMGYEVPD